MVGIGSGSGLGTPFEPFNRSAAHYSDETLYFRSYDNLDESCTWVSRLISRDQPERLIKSNAVSLYEDDTGPGEQA